MLGEKQTFCFVKKFGKVGFVICVQNIFISPGDF